MSTDTQSAKRAVLTPRNIQKGCRHPLDLGCGTFDTPAISATSGAFLSEIRGVSRIPWPKSGGCLILYRKRYFLTWDDSDAGIEQGNPGLDTPAISARKRKKWPRSRGCQRSLSEIAGVSNAAGRNQGGVKDAVAEIEGVSKAAVRNRGGNTSVLWATKTEICKRRTRRQWRSGYRINAIR